MEIHLEGNQVQLVQLRIYEPPRFFESFLQGRQVAGAGYRGPHLRHLSGGLSDGTATREKALAMELPAEVALLRRLLYCGEWIESHALHMIMLHAPDFLGYDSSIAMAADHRQLFEDGLRIRHLGNMLLTVLGGRAIHPINVTVGGFYRAPRASELRELLPELAWARQRLVPLLVEMAGWIFPDLQVDYQCVALQHPDQYPLNEGRVVASDGLNVPIEEYEQHFQERHVAHSTALQSVRLPDQTHYLVGPLARLNLCRDQLTESAARLCQQLLPERPLRNNALSLLARGIEVLFALETTELLIAEYQSRRPPERVEIPARGGVGCHATEAPRGLLYHRYEVDDQGGSRRPGSFRRLRRTKGRSRPICGG